VTPDLAPAILASTMAAKRKRPGNRRGRMRRPATMSGADFHAALRQLGEADILASPVVDTFADRSGAARATVYRWIDSNTVPPWAEWIVKLLQRQQQLAGKLVEPAE
jgi:hypothetical protein